MSGDLHTDLAGPSGSESGGGGNDNGRGGGREVSRRSDSEGVVKAWSRSNRFVPRDERRSVCVEEVVPGLPEVLCGGGLYDRTLPLLKLDFRELFVVYATRTTECGY